MPILINDYDAVRYLAEIDRRHIGLAPISDRWFERTDYRVASVRAADGTPLVAVVLGLNSPCPIDPTATVRIKYWLANLDRAAELGDAFIANVITIRDGMRLAGKQRVWGAVPKSAEHILQLLEPVAAAGACQKHDGDEVPIDGAVDEACYENHWLFLGDRETVTEAVV